MGGSLPVGVYFIHFIGASYINAFVGFSTGMKSDLSRFLEKILNNFFWSCRHLKYKYPDGTLS